MRIDNIPQELKVHPYWCLWKYEKRNGKPTKIPYNPLTGQRGRANTSNTFAPFTDALEAFQRGSYDGLGIGIFEGIGAVDIDGQFSPITGPSEQAQAVIDMLGSYAEVSPSGKGLRIIFRAPGFQYDKTRYYIHNGKAGLEVYIAGCTSKFVTITGNAINALPVNERPEQIAAMLEAYMIRPGADRAQTAKQTAPGSRLADDDVIAKATAAHGDKFTQLWSGDVSGHNSDNSTADLALCNLLAFWCGGDMDQMDRIFRQSGLYREKWEREDYRSGTLEKAVQDCKQFYGQSSTAAEDFAGVERPETEGFETIDAIDLYKMNLAPIKFIVESLLPQGLTLLCAPSKYGKSWLSLDLVISVAGGWKFLNHDTARADTLYLALEDGYNRLKSRMTAITQGLQPPPGVRFALRAKTVDQGLEKQIDAHMSKYPNTGLIIIDVLARVRTSNPKRGMSAYALDYADMGTLKTIADKHGIAIMCVHHDRKMKDESDYFNKISGTNGIMGAADTIMLITRENRTDDTSVLRITGRDVESQELVMHLDLQTTYRWQLVSTVEQEAQDKTRQAYEADPFVITIRGLLKENPQGVSLKAAEIKERMTDFTDVLLSEVQIGYAIKRLEPDMFKYDRVLHKKTGAGYKTHIFMVKP